MIPGRKTWSEVFELVSPLHFDLIQAVYIGKEY